MPVDASEPPNSTLASAGVRISYHDTGGPGQPVVVLHGLAGSAAEFFATAAALPDFRWILIDLRGHGRSTRHPEDLSRAAFVADVVRVMEAVLAGPAVVVGQSLGGHTAMLTAARRPDLVSGLVLLESGAAGLPPGTAAGVGAYFRSWPVPFPDSAAARLFLGDAPLQRAWAADLEERDGGLWPRFDPGVMEAALGELARPRWKEWESIACPALVVYGTEGSFPEEERTEFIRRGRSARRVDLAGASHDAHLDSAEAWIAALGGFLRGLSSGRWAGVPAAPRTDGPAGPPCRPAVPDAAGTGTDRVG
jgi:pimeloyl-ACP methyl ester carboxylesterase